MKPDYTRNEKEEESVDAMDVELNALAEVQNRLDSLAKIKKAIEKAVFYHEPLGDLPILYDDALLNLQLAQAAYIRFLLNKSELQYVKEEICNGR